MQHERSGTIILDDLRYVGREYQAAISALIEQFFVRSTLKAVVADRDDLIDQVAIEIDGKRQREIEPCPHPRRVSDDRFGQVFAQFGEIFNKIAHQLERLIINSADQADVVVSGHASGNPPAAPTGHDTDIVRSMLPIVGNSMPETRRIKVDLPEPLRPSTATFSPGLRSNETLLRTR